MSPGKSRHGWKWLTLGVAVAAVAGFLLGRVVEVETSHEVPPVTKNALELVSAIEESNEDARKLAATVAVLRSEPQTGRPPRPAHLSVLKGTTLRFGTGDVASKSDTLRYYRREAVVGILNYAARAARVNSARAAVVALLEAAEKKRQSCGSAEAPEPSEPAPAPCQVDSGVLVLAGLRVLDAALSGRKDELNDLDGGNRSLVQIGEAAIGELRRSGPQSE